MRIPKKAKIPIGVIWAVLIGIVFITPAIASSDMPLEFDCDCNIEIIGTPELNKPFEAIFTWTPRKDVNLSKNIPDTVRLWHGFDNTRYVSGDTLWIGDLHKDQTYTMNARFMVFNPGYCEIRSRIVTMRAKGYYYNPYKKVDNGVPAEKICRSNRSFLVDPNKDTTTSYKADMKWFYTESGDSFAVGNVILPENLSIGKPPVVAKAADNVKAAKRSGEITIIQPDTNVIYLTRSDIFSKRAITLSSLKTNKIIFPENINNIEIDTTCALRFEKSSDNVIIIDKPKTECKLIIFLDDSLYLLPVKTIR